MNNTTRKIATALLTLGALLVPASQADAAAAPAWRFDIVSNPTNLSPGLKSFVSFRVPQYNLVATNVGTAPTKGPVTITDTLPKGLTLKGAVPSGQSVPGTCTVAAPTATCVFPGPIQPGQFIDLQVYFDVDGTGTVLHEGDTILDEATLTGGGTSAVIAKQRTRISAADPPFGFNPDTAGFGITPYADDGTAQETAGAHPHVLSVNLNFVTSNKARSGTFAIPSPVDGGVRDVDAFLPRGMVVNPTATPVRCTEVQLEALGCPPASQVGTLNTSSAVGAPLVLRTEIYNMAPAPGNAGTFAGVVVVLPIHIQGGLRAGDYTIASETNSLPGGLYLKPALATQLLLWGDPSSSSFDYVRRSSESGCPKKAGAADDYRCPVPPQDTPFLTMPTSCAEKPVAEGATDSWGHPGQFATRANVLRDANDNEIGVTDCAGLEFNPTLKARPTTNVADSPSGLDFDLEVPQTNSLSERATAQLRKDVTVLPEGMSLNPSSANGLGSCSLAQVGIDPSPNKVQRVTYPSGASLFVLQLEGQDTAPIPASADAATVQAALEALPNVGQGNVSVTDVYGAWRIEFTGALANSDNPLLEGFTLSDEIEKVAVNATGGAFTLTHGADTTADIAATATAAQVQSAINALPSVSAEGGSVTVSGGPGNAGATTPYVVTFKGGPLAGADQSMSAQSSATSPLTGAAATVTVSADVEGGQPLASMEIATTQAGGKILPNGNPVTCPDSSRIGSIEVNSQLVDHPLPGSIYVATPYDNAFGSLLAIYAVIDDPISGTLIKLPGKVEADPATGRLISIFDNNPQLPFTHFKANFFGGAHGVLRTPAVCGNYSTTSSLTPWSAPDSGPPATPHDDYAIATPPSGGSCAPDQPNLPSMDAGVVSPIARSYSPFVLHLRRPDGSQQFSSFTTKLPPGLTAKLAGVGQCSDAALASAAAKSGREEQSSPSCPASSHVGEIVAGAGAGPSPYYAHGDAYLSGPYKGAPLSITVITPAVAGPYDLGTIVVRAALRIDQVTGQATAATDQIPSILQGIPLDVRTIDVKLDRPSFALTGTSCDPSSIDASLTSTLGQVASLTSRFQLGECTGLAFKPKLGIRLFGSTRRGGHPALRGTVTMPEGGANISEASVALPHTEFLDQAHIGTVCTRVQFAEGDGNGSACPAASIYGTATATSPLVDYALEGNAYLRSSSHELPDLVIALHGPPSQPIAVDAVGRIDSVKGGIRTTFEGVPDLPVSSFVLSMQGGRKGLLQNSTNICRKVNRATALFEGQNGKGIELTPALKNGKCGKAKRSHKRHHRRGDR